MHLLFFIPFYFFPNKLLRGSGKYRRSPWDSISNKAEKVTANWKGISNGHSGSKQACAATMSVFKWNQNYKCILFYALCSNSLLFDSIPHLWWLWDFRPRLTNQNVGNQSNSWGEVQLFLHTTIFCLIFYVSHEFSYWRVGLAVPGLTKLRAQECRAWGCFFFQASVLFL